MIAMRSCALDNDLITSFQIMNFEKLPDPAPLPKYFLIASYIREHRLFYAAMYF